MIESCQPTRPAGQQSIFLGLGLAEIIVGLMAIIAADVLPVFDELAVVSGVLGLFALTFCVLRPESVKVYDILGAALLFGYGTGALNSVVSFAIAHQELIQASPVAQYWFTRSLGLALTACGLLHVIGRIDRQGYLLTAAIVASGQQRRIAHALLLLFAVYVFFLTSGRIGFMGSVSVAHTNVESSTLSQVSPLAVLVLALATPVGAMAFAYAIKGPRKSSTILSLAVSVILLLFQFGLGRRVFIFSLVMYFMCALYVIKPARVLTVKNAVLLGVSIFVLQAATTGFYALRIAHWQAGQSSSSLNILELIPRAVKIYEEDRRGDLQASIHQNLMSRTFVLRYLAEISQGVDSHEPLYGLDFHRALVVVTPSALYEGKFRDKLAIVEEDLINPRFGLPAYDEANTIFIAGLADFGIPGLFLYPILLCVVLSLVLRMMVRAPAAAQLIVGLVILQALLSVEQDISGYLESLRNLVLIAGMSWVAFGWATDSKPVRSLSRPLFGPHRHV